MHSRVYGHRRPLREHEMLRPGLRHRRYCERRRRVRNAGAFLRTDAGALCRTDAGTGRPDGQARLRADAAAFLTPFIKADAAAHKQTESPADAGAVAQARRPHGRAGPRAFSKAHAGAVATANAAPDAAALFQTVEAPNIQTDAAAVARADAGAR